MPPRPQSTRLPRIPHEAAICRLHRPSVHQASDGVHFLVLRRHLPSLVEILVARAAPDHAVGSFFGLQLH